MIDKIKNWFKKQDAKELMNETIDILRHLEEIYGYLTISELGRGENYITFAIADKNGSSIAIVMQIYYTNNYTGITIETDYQTSNDHTAVILILREYTPRKVSFSCDYYKKNKYMCTGDIQEILMDNIDLQWLRMMLKCELSKKEEKKNDKSAEEVQNV